MAYMFKKEFIRKLESLPEEKKKLIIEDFERRLEEIHEIMDRIDAKKEEHNHED